MRPWVRVLAGALVLGVVGWRLGAGPFVEAARSTSPVALAAALGITALTTVCSAWRWHRVAGGLGVDVPLGSAVGAYYRSQFLNATLPGGVVGDVHRAVRHGAAPVVAERSVGQVVQVVATAAVLLAGPWPAGSVVAVVAVLAALVRWPVVVLTSLVAAAGHVGVFLVAAHAAGIHAPLVELMPLALVVLLAAAIPLSIAGWGPREGAAAWVFAGAGLGATEGATVAIVYGVLALVATLPGAFLLTRGVIRG
jgi:hypothetical protein